MPHLLLSTRLQPLFSLAYIFICVPLELTTIFNAAKTCRKWVIFKHSPRNTKGGLWITNSRIPLIGLILNYKPNPQEDKMLR